MRLRHVVAMVAFLIFTVAVQTTLFARFRPFDSAPALVLLVVMMYTRYLPAEYALLTGFSAGLFLDLLAESPLGLWALVLTAVAYLVLRYRDRVEDEFAYMAPFVVIVTVVGLALFAILGTIFGEKTLADAGVIRKVLLPAVYNLAFTPLVLRLVPLTLGVSRYRDPAFRL